MDDQKRNYVICRGRSCKVLTGLNKRIDKDVQSISVESPDAIEEFLKDLG